MVKEIKTEIHISASPERVWKILTDFERYPDWNPFLKWLKGDVAIGKKIKVRIQPPGSGGMTFTPTVLEYEANRKLSWLGQLWFPGLFKGNHSFELIDNRDGTTTFKHDEIFTGILIGILNVKQTTEAFESLNRKLKELAERR